MTRYAARPGKPILIEAGRSRRCGQRVAGTCAFDPFVCVRFRQLRRDRPRCVRQPPHVQTWRFHRRSHRCRAAVCTRRALPRNSVPCHARHGLEVGGARNLDAGPNSLPYRWRPCSGPTTRRTRCATPSRPQACGLQCRRYFTNGGFRPPHALLYSIAVACILSFLLALLVPHMADSGLEAVQNSHAGEWRGVFGTRIFSARGRLWVLCCVSPTSIGGGLRIYWWCAGFCALLCLIFSNSVTSQVVFGSRWMNRLWPDSSASFQPIGGDGALCNTGRKFWCAGGFAEIADFSDFRAR